jgi:hypothetical protein
VIALPFALAVAHAAEPRGKNQCSVDDAFPIAGTASFANALSALRTNAQTWSAAGFAEQHQLRRLALADRDVSDDEVLGFAAAQANIQMGVTRVAVFQEDATYGECPADYVLGSRPVDLYAYNVGLAFRWKRIGAFYSSAVTLGYLGELAYLRAYQTMGALTVGPMLTAMVPLTGSWSTQVGTSAYAQDFVAGVIVDAEVGDLRAGYTQSRGWYASGQDRWIGLFGSVVARDNFTRIGQARAGLQRAALPDKVADVAGRPSVFAQVLPLTEAVVDGDAATQIDLTTGNLAQEGIGGLVDVRFAYAIRPVAQIHDLAFAVHDRAWYDLLDGVTPEGRWHAYAEAGFVNLPPQYYYGLAGGTVVQARAELLYTQGSGSARVTAMFNDPEQTALYPFSVNTLAIRVQGSGAF